MRLLVGVYLVGAALLVGGGCRGGDDASSKGDSPAKSAKAAEAAKAAKAKAVKGPFANAVQVNDRGWMMTGDLTPPPVDKDDGSFSIDGDGDGEMDAQRGGGGAKKKRFGQSPLYVDGKPIAVVAYGELPAWLPTRPVKLSDGREAIRFRIAEYFEALGIPLGKIQEVHLYGGRGRIAIIPGKEIRRVKKQLLFSFTEGDNGKMRMHWDSKLDVSDTIDKVQAVAIYIDKKAPKWDRGQWGLVGDDGVKIEGIPYAGTPLKGGVRIYLDGRIAHHLKRNQTFERKTDPHRIVDGAPYFRLFDYLEETGVDTSGVTAVELLDKNSIIRRLDGAELSGERATIEISAPKGVSGQVVVHFGPADHRTSLSVSSIQLYTAKRASARNRR